MRPLAAILLLAAGLALVHGFPGPMRDSSESMETEEKGKIKDNRDVSIDRVSRMFDTAVQMEEEEEELSKNPVHGAWRPPFKFSDLVPLLKVFSGMREPLSPEQLASQFAPGGVFPWGSKLPELANSTSTTKIIGNNKVTINQTTYIDGDEINGTVFRIRTVDVKALNNVPEEEEVREEVTDMTEGSATEMTEDATDFPKNQVETVIV